jgi:hypothetical protein
MLWDKVSHISLILSLFKIDVFAISVRVLAQQRKTTSL